MPLDAAPYGILNIVMIGFLSFFSFGYYRIFEAFLNGYPEYFYSNQELIERKAEARPEFWSHFMPGLLYVLLTIVVLVLVVYF